MLVEISVFPSRSPKGKSLEEMLLGLDGVINRHLATLLSTAHGLDIEVVINSISSSAPEYEFHRAVLYSDVVIFDGSLEEDGIALGENYACIPHAPYLMDNVIVVSRTELPINFIPNAYQTILC